MDTLMEKKEYRKRLPNSSLLVKQAKEELEKYGEIKVICPKCGKIPKITTTSRSERTIIKCDCKYICDMEINL